MTLNEFGYIVVRWDGDYVGLRLSDISHHAKRAKGYELAKEEVEDLAGYTGNEPDL